MSDGFNKLTWWRLRMSEFDFDILYRSGIKHQAKDALSRFSTVESDEEIGRRSTGVKHQTENVQNRV